MEKSFLDVAFEVKAVDESGIFEGYGSTFGLKDAHNDVVMPGAFTKTLQAGGRNKNGIAMLFSHDAHRPIGVWTSLQEDKKGLKVEGKLAMGTQDGKETWELMRLGALRGLSIGYDCIIHEYDDKKKVRFLKELDLWEISPVVFPANTSANIGVVKSIESAKSASELQSTLLSAGFSEEATGYLVKAYKPSSTTGEGGLSGVLNSLKEMNAQMYQEAVQDHKALLESIEKMGCDSAEAVETLWKIAEAAIRKLEAADIEKLSANMDDHFTKATRVLVDGRLCSMEKNLREREPYQEDVEVGTKDVMPERKPYKLTEYEKFGNETPLRDPLEYYDNIVVAPGSTSGRRLAGCIEIGPVGT